MLFVASIEERWRELQAVCVELGWGGFMKRRQGGDQGRAAGWLLHVVNEACSVAVDHCCQATCMWRPPICKSMLKMLANWIVAGTQGSCVRVVRDRLKHTHNKVACFVCPLRPEHPK